MAVGEISSPLDQIPKKRPGAAVSEDLNRELEEELKKVKQFQPTGKLDIPKEVNPSEASVSPPETFLNLPMIVMQGMGSYKLSMTVKEFITMQAHDSVKYEQLSKNQWVCRFYLTDKLARQNHEISILFLFDTDEALLSRVIFDETELSDRDKYMYVMTVDTARKEKSAPPVKTHETSLKIPGMTWSNEYWAKVKSIITREWKPPTVKAGQTYMVTVKFQFQRDGTVKDIGVQQSSGNAKFDEAGEQAIRRARFLPAFLPYFTDSYKDVEMVFSVRGK